MPTIKHILSKLHTTSLLIFYIIFFVLIEVECARKKKKKFVKSKRPGDGSLSAMLYTGLFFIALVFVPIIGIFIYRMVKDPITPDLIKNGWEYLKERSFGYLSASNKAKQVKKRM